MARDQSPFTETSDYTLDAGPPAAAGVHLTQAKADLLGKVAAQCGYNPARFVALLQAAHGVTSAYELPNDDEIVNNLILHMQKMASTKKSHE